MPSPCLRGYPRGRCTLVHIVCELLLAPIDLVEEELALERFCQREGDLAHTGGIARHDECMSRADRVRYEQFLQRRDPSLP